MSIRAGSGAAVVIGIGLRFVVNLEPHWLLAWILPVLLLTLALRTNNRTAPALVVLAALIGHSANAPFLLKMTPLPLVILITALQGLLWMFVVSSVSRIIRAYDSAWTILALPVIWVAADTLLAHLTPDGNWGSLAYSQSDVLPVAQMASVFGVVGILFVVLLFNSALAVAIHRGLRLPHAVTIYSAVVVVVIVTVTLGWWRLHSPTQGELVSIGLASIDDFIRGADTDRSREVWHQYDAQARKAHLAKVAAANRVWLVAGIGVDNGQERAVPGKVATRHQ
jgi:apolipoprotein N-acyltransferase